MLFVEEGKKYFVLTMNGFLVRADTCLGGSLIQSCVRITWRAYWFPFLKFLTPLVWGEGQNLHFYLKFPGDGDAAGPGPTLCEPSFRASSLGHLLPCEYSTMSGSLWFLVWVEVYVRDHRQATFSLRAVFSSAGNLNKKPESLLKPDAISKPSFS